MALVTRPPIFTRTAALKAANLVLDHTAALNLGIQAFKDSFELDVLIPINVGKVTTKPELVAELFAYAEGIRDHMAYSLARYHCDFMYRHNGKLFNLPDANKCLDAEQKMQASAAHVWKGTDLAFTEWEPVSKLLGGAS